MNAKDLTNTLRPLLADRKIRTETHDGQAVEMYVLYVDILPPAHRGKGQGNVVIGNVIGADLTMWARDVRRVNVERMEQSGLLRVWIVKKDGEYRDIFVEDDGWQ